MKRLEELKEFVEDFHTAPTLEEMPRRSLVDKGIYGPTGAHVIEEIHTPFNLAYISITTGSTAFQNIVGVTHSEIEDRVKASEKALALSGLKKGDSILFTYPPLVNVFSKNALDSYGLNWSFLKNSSRDALILALCEEKPKAVIGESSFLRAALEDADRMGLASLLPQGLILITAGTPLDLELIPAAEKYVSGTVHDLYGCQEFGWLTLDGIELREDINLIPSREGDSSALFVGGLSTGDNFPVSDQGHVCNPQGKIITYSRVRASSELETRILETTASGRDTIDRLAKTILRIKAKVVRVSPDLKLDSDQTVLEIYDPGNPSETYVIQGPENTRMIDSLLQAQMEYQSQKKTDLTWIKGR